MEKLNLDELPAFPDNVADCHAEFVRLYTSMYNERIQTWKRIEKLMLAHKSAVGEIKSYKKQYLETKKKLESLKMKLSSGVKISLEDL